jgi:hypothetical protein
MAEWSKAAVLKTVSRQRDVGSNPTPSAIKSLRDFISWPQLTLRPSAKYLVVKITKSLVPKILRFYGEMAE